MARRTSSTTSLARFARANSPEFANRSLDFCNAFWGAGDAGVDVVFARMRGATRTIDELRGFWKERYANSAATRWLYHDNPWLTLAAFLERTSKKSTRSNSQSLPNRIWVGMKLGTSSNHTTSGRANHSRLSPLQRTSELA